MLHHIPNYLGFVGRAADLSSAGGAFVSFQDPLWYPRRPWWDMAADRGAYFAWRVAQGDLVSGARTRVRRLRGVYDETCESDGRVPRRTAGGRAGLAQLLQQHFDQVSVILYWSTHAERLQPLGKRLHLANHIGLVASGAHAPST